MKHLLACLLALLALPTAAQRPEFLQYLHDPWVDSTLQALTPEQRAAQLMMVAGYSRKGPEHRQALRRLVEQHGIGGIIYFQGGPQRQAALSNYLNAHAQVPLLQSIDGEWGLAMRLDSTMAFPYQMALGAIQNDSLLEAMGLAIAEQCRALGLHVNFAPVADINNNPKNPVISFRSFGEGRELVARKSLAYMRGLQQGFVMANAKHFPGHGDTDVDSHLNLPLIAHSASRLDTLELFPFRALIAEGVGSMMVAHLSIPALDPTPKLPSTLSRPIVGGLLRDSLGFEGLVFTDALNMQGIAKFFQPGEIEVKALLAGNDVLLFPEDVPKALQAIRKAVASGQLKQADIDASCRRVLAAKRWAGLHRYEPVVLDGLMERLHTPQHRLLLRQLTAASLTVLRNENAIPVQELAQTRIASVSIGADDTTVFQRTLSHYAPIDHFLLPKKPTAQQVAALRKQLAGYDLVIAGLHQMRKVPYNHLDYNEPTLLLLSELASGGKTIFALFRNPYVLSGIDWIEKAAGLAVAYQDTDMAQHLMAQLLFGGIGASGRLPVSVGGKFPAGSGFDTPGGLRLEYTLPEDVGLDGDALMHRIDSVAHLAIRARAVPGMQVLAALHGKVFLHQAYGYHTYDSLRPVQPGDLYDLASVTKVAAATLALMKLEEEGKFGLDEPLGKYHAPWNRGNKRGLTFRAILSHHAGLQAWIPYWQEVVRKDGRYKPRWVRAGAPQGEWQLPMADSLYASRFYPLRIQRLSRKAKPLPEPAKYVYSDLSFYTYPSMVQRLTGFRFDHYLEQAFYAPLGASTVCFRPLERYPLAQVVPTEADTFFRKRLLQGYVHDEGAALMGGLSGHAGLFASANDLAKVMQMLLNGGEYGGRRYLEAATIDRFNTRYYADDGNRRGLGFDKMMLERPERGTPSPLASDRSFGHTGFTGTFAWVDPENGLLFIFLANRVHPTRQNGKLYDLNIRTQLHQVLYEALPPE